MRNLLFAIIGIALFCSWSTITETPIKRAEWLIGTWENKTPKGKLYETWVKVNADELFGKSYALKGNDTIVFETVRIVQEKDSLFYIPTVKNQNNNLPVRFTLKTSSGTKLLFENITHDFPQVIAYSQMSTDSLVAEISGTRNGKEHKEVFPMKRVK